MTKEDKLKDSEIERNKEVSKTLRINRRVPYYKSASAFLVILIVVFLMWYMII